LYCQLKTTALFVPFLIGRFTSCSRQALQMQYYRAKYPQGDHFLSVPTTWEGTLLQYLPSDVYGIIGFYSLRGGTFKKTYRFLDKFGSHRTRLIGQPWRQDIPHLTKPNAVAIEPKSGHYFVSDKFQRIFVYDSTKGMFLRTFGSPGNQDGQFLHISSLCFDFSGMLVVVDSQGCRVQVLDPSQGQLILKFGQSGRENGDLYYPHGITLDEAGNFVIADTSNDRIQIFDPEGNWIRSFGPISGAPRGYPGPVSVGVDLNTGNFVIADIFNHRIQIWSESGSHIRDFGGHGSKIRQLDSPRGVAVDRYGRIVVCDSSNHRVQFFSRTGIYLPFMKFGREGKGRGELKYPTHPVIDPHGNVVLADLGNDRIQIFGLPEKTPQQRKRMELQKFKTKNQKRNGRKESSSENECC